MATKEIVAKGDPVLVIIDQYGPVYEGIVSTGMEPDDIKQSPRCLVYADPQGWCLGTRELVKSSFEELNDILEMFGVNSKRVRSVIEKKGFVWVAWARLNKSGRFYNRSKRSKK